MLGNNNKLIMEILIMISIYGEECMNILHLLRVCFFNGNNAMVARIYHMAYTREEETGG